MTLRIWAAAIFIYWASFLTGSSSWANIEEEKNLPNGITPARKDSAGNLPSDLLKKLFKDYQTQDFEMATQITTGKMGKAVSDLHEIQKSYGGKLPQDMVEFFRQLVGMKVLAEYQRKDHSIVRIFWILHLPEKYNKKLFYTKIHSIDYFLTKDSESKEWKIADAKFRKEYVINNPLPQF